MILHIPFSDDTPVVPRPTAKYIILTSYGPVLAISRDGPRTGVNPDPLGVAVCSIEHNPGPFSGSVDRALVSHANDDIRGCRFKTPSCTSTNMTATMISDTPAMRVCQVAEYPKHYNTVSITTGTSSDKAETYNKE